MVAISLRFQVTEFLEFSEREDLSYHLQISNEYEYAQALN